MAQERDPPGRGGCKPTWRHSMNSSFSPTGVMEEVSMYLIAPIRCASDSPSSAETKPSEVEDGPERRSILVPHRIKGTSGLWSASSGRNFISAFSNEVLSATEKQRTKMLVSGYCNTRRRSYSSWPADTSKNVSEIRPNCGIHGTVAPVSPKSRWYGFPRCVTFVA